MYKKSNAFVYKFAVNYQVFEKLRQGAPFKAENWNPLSREQYLSKHRFLDVPLRNYWIKRNLAMEKVGVKKAKIRDADVASHCYCPKNIHLETLMLNELKSELNIYIKNSDVL